MTHGRVSALVVAFVVSLAVTADADAQSLSSAPASLLDPSMTSPFSLRTNSLFDVTGPPEGGPYAGGPHEDGPHAMSMFEAGQIVDRPTADLRPRFHWGLIGSFVPHWSTPAIVGDLFFESFASTQMSGRDVRVGVTRGRQLGFEMGVSFVRKTISSLAITHHSDPQTGLTTTRTYTGLSDIDMTGVDAHVVLPLVRIGERVQIGVLAGGGVAWLPDTPIQLQIEGPPFFADANSQAALDTPPAVGGFVRGYDGDTRASYPLVPGTRHAITQRTLSDAVPTQTYWPLLRGQLAADFLLAPPLKVRLAAGFHYPGTQALGVDVVYLFRTGRVGTTQSRPDPAAAAAVQLADRPRVIAPRQSYWGVLGGATPRWWTPDTWGGNFNDAPSNVEGREFRVGLTRGRPLGYEFGLSFVLKSMTEFSFERQGRLIPTTNGQAPIAAVITFSRIDPVQIPGAEFHAFIPMGRLGPRVQIGGLLGLGGARVPSDPILKHIEGPPYLATETSTIPLATLPAGGGFVVDDVSALFPVGPGQTGTTVTTIATTISPLGRFMFLARAQIAADVLLAAPFKLRFSGGFNYPGAQLYGVEMVYMFGTGR